MCGICGWIDSDTSRGVNTPSLDAMNFALLHRGPDDGATWTRRNVGLGARRLSVIDVAHGHQPMANEDESRVIVFNGEIYNAGEIRADLEALGHRFRTRCDTEVVLRAYEAWEEAAVQRLNGMFAFAVWDARRERLYAARDRVGIKPLVYTERGGVFAFSSELDSLARSGLVEGRINPAALDAYLTYLYVPHPDTIYSGVHALGPGEALIWQRGRLRREVYWRPQFRPTASWRMETAAEAYADLLQDAVRRQRVSDVPLGAFLSGGVDSTSIVAFLAESGAGRVKTFTIGFDDPGADERKFARMAADAFGTDHVEAILKADAAAMSGELIRHFGEPFADSSAIPTWMVSKLAREHVTVALSGDGGDELFAGYSWLHMTRRVSRYAQWPRALRELVDAALWLAPRSPKWDKVRRFSADAALAPVERFRRRQTCFTPAERAALYTPGTAAAVGAAALDRFGAHWDEAGATTDDDRMLHQDLRMYLPDDVLTKVDRMSMAVSLEVRVPLLDHRIVEFAATVPFEMKYNRGESKRLMKSALKDKVPAALLEQRKRGFSLPVHRWFRGDAAVAFEEVVLGADARSAAYLDGAELRALYDAHRAGRRDAGHHLWALMMFEQWLRYAARLPGVTPGL
jgi:asparagine synthase (glutamine-hydrolysing)